MVESVLAGLAARRFVIGPFFSSFDFGAESRFHYCSVPST